MDQQPSAKVVVSEKSSVTVLAIQGYLEGSAGAQLTARVDDFLRLGKVAIIIDFSACPVVNSIGMSHIVEIKDRILFDYKGKLALVALKPIMKKAFAMAQIIPDALEAATIDQAVAGLTGA